MSAVSPEQLLERLARHKPIAAILLLGEDLYLRDSCREKLVEAYVEEGARAWAVSRFSLGEVKLDRIVQQAQTLPMLSPTQVVFASDVEELENLGDEAREEAVERLKSYLDDPAPFTVLVLEAVKLDQRTKLFKLLGDAALVVRVELSDAKDADQRRAAAIEAAKDLVKGMGREAGATIDPEAGDDLVEALNGDLAAIRMEIEKLATYVGDKRRITLADVDVLVVSEHRYSVWQLADMLAARDRDRALTFLDSLLRRGEQPAGLVGALAWMYRKLVQAQEAPANSNKYQAAGRLKLRPEAAEVALRSAHRIPRKRLLAGLGALYEADSQLKSNSKEAEKRIILEFLLTRLTA